VDARERSVRLAAADGAVDPCPLPCPAFSGTGAGSRTEQYVRYKQSRGVRKPATVESHLAEIIAPLATQLVVHPRRRDEMERLRELMVGSM